MCTAACWNEEFSRLDNATARIPDDLLTLATRVEKEIVDNLVNASTAVKTVFLRWEKG